MTREEWKKARQNGIGASEAACILGLNPWKSNVQLWEEKVGIATPPDLDGKPVVEYGKAAEAHLRELFALDHPQYNVYYDEFGLVANIPEYPWLFATLDGELDELYDCEKQHRHLVVRKGVLEITPTEIQRAGDWKKWDNQIPDYYYVQVLHQLLATWYDFAILKAQIKWHKDGEMQLTTRHYRIERALVLEDMEHLLKEEIKFWECVTSKTRPPLILPDI